MGELVRSLSARAKNWIFGTYFTVLFFLAMFPPAYLALGTREPLVLGLPLAIVYMVGVSVLVTIGVVALYWVERVRGELN